MKRFLFSAMAVLPLLFSSCGWQVPETVSVKSQAVYNFSLGKFDWDFSEYISATSMNDLMNTDNTGESTEFKVYDYNPESKSKSQQFLIDFPISSFDIDQTSSFDGLTFTQSMDYEKNIEVPDLLVDNVPSTIEIPDINEKIVDTFKNVSFSSITVPQGLNGAVSDLYINVSISSPSFDTMTFSQGALILTISASSVPSDFATDLTLSLVKDDGSGSLISSVSNVNLNSTLTTVNLPLDGKSLTKNMKLVFTGTEEGGTLGDTIEFATSASLSTSSKVSKATGLTIASSEFDEIDTTQTISISSADEFVSCKIGTGSIKMKASYPSGWTGISCTKEVKSTNGVLDFENDDFTLNTAESDNTVLFDRNLDLAGKIYAKGNIIINISVAFGLDNATIVLPEGVTPEITTNASCSISKISEITVDLSADSSQLDINDIENLPSSVQDKVTKISYHDSGVKITYTNTLPTGNDITLQADSSFFGLSGKTGVMVSGKTNAGPLDFTGTADVDNWATDGNIDMKFKMLLPGFGDDAAHPYYATFKNVEVGKSYTIKTTVETEFNWDDITVKTDGTAQTGTIDTGVNLDSMFGDLGTAIGNTDFTKRLMFKQIPLLLEIGIPDSSLSSSFASFGINGTIKVYVKDHESETALYILGSSDGNAAFSASSLPELKFNSNKTVISKQPVDSDTKDLAEIMNKHLSGNLVCSYSIQIGDGSELTITKEDYDNYCSSKNTGGITIGVNGRLIFPMEMTVASKKDAGLDASDETSPLEMDILEMAGFDGTDIFGRTEATDTSDIDKFLDAMDCVKIMSSVTNKVFVYNNSSNKITVNFSSSVTGVENHLINLGNDFAVISSSEFKTMLQTAPFKPDLKINLPVGDLYIPRDPLMIANISIRVITDGTYTIF